jgi:hypothetical protein
VANRSSQSKRDFIPKRNFIGRKFCETDKKGFFAKKYFFEDEEKLPKRLPKRIEEKGGFLSDKNEKSFEVSFDGSFTRGFEGTEFIVSLPIINGMDQAALKDYLPKRGANGFLSGSSESEGKKPRSNIGGGIAMQRDLGLPDSDEDDTSSEEEQRPPSDLRKIAGAWERRALRAEESLKRYQEGLMERTGEAKLKDTLSFLLNSDSGVIDERNSALASKSTWNARAFDTMEEDEWLVLKIPQANLSHVLCDFCDGDKLDDKHWLEGPFSQSLTVRELLEYKRGSNRERRRACTDNLLRKAHWRGSKQNRVEKPTTRSASSSSNGESRTKKDNKEMSPKAKERSGSLSESELNMAKADFRNRVVRYHHVDLLESERKRKREESRRPLQTHMEGRGQLHSSQSNDPPIVTAWPVLQSAGEKRGENQGESQAAAKGWELGR